VRDRRLRDDRRQASVQQRLARSLWFAYHRVTLRGWNEPFVGHPLQDVAPWLVPGAKTYRFVDARGLVWGASAVLSRAFKKVGNRTDLNSSAGDLIERPLTRAICAHLKVTPIPRRSPFDRRQTDRRSSRYASFPDVADLALSCNSRSLFSGDKRRADRRFSIHERLDDDRRKSPLIRRFTMGVWYAYHRATLCGVDEVCESGSQQLASEIILRELRKYRFLDRNGKECEHRDVLSTAVWTMNTSISNAVTAARVISEFVAVLDLYEITPVERRSAFDRRLRDRRNEKLE